MNKSAAASHDPAPAHEERPAIDPFMRRLENERTINQILRTVAEPGSLEEILLKCLDLLLATSWLSILPKGGVFLVGKEGGFLELTAQRNLSAPLMTLCARVAFGQCLCGRAAATKKIIHAACVDHRHEIRFDGMQSHGHYNVPILDGGTVLGVLVLYLPHEHESSASETDFLESVSDILSLVIRLKQHQSHLEEVVQERTKNLVQAMQEAQVANKVKTEFLANISHELNTPLNAIIGFSEIMMNEMFGPLGGNMYTEYSKDIHNSGTHLKSIISDIMDISKVELGRVDMCKEELQVRDVLEFPIQLVRQLDYAEGINIHCAIPENICVFMGDKVRIRQIILNIVSNAVKYTKTGGRVDITAQKDHLGGLVISVADTGIGIDKEQLAHVEEPFYRAAGSFARSHEGTGLGLTLAKRLMEAHGGRLEIISLPGKGTVVHLRFPAESSVE